MYSVTETSVIPFNIIDYIMNTNQEEFQNKKYTVLRNIVSEQICSFVTNILFLRNQIFGEVKDIQCPISSSFYGIESTETLLATFTPIISSIANIPLFPTYSYSRIYRKGEVLEKHKDRPECAFSATICLGKGFFNETNNPVIVESAFEPIYVDGSEINLNIGDALLYKGCEVEHWRNELQCDWMTQVFLHYVIASPQNESIYFDGRKNLMYVK